MACREYLTLLEYTTRLNVSVFLEVKYSHVTEFRPVKPEWRWCVPCLDLIHINLPVVIVYFCFPSPVSLNPGLKECRVTYHKWLHGRLSIKHDCTLCQWEINFCVLIHWDLGINLLQQLTLLTLTYVILLDLNISDLGSSFIGLSFK